MRILMINTTNKTNITQRQRKCDAFVLYETKQLNAALRTHNKQSEHTKRESVTSVCFVTKKKTVENNIMPPQPSQGSF